MGNRQNILEINGKRYDAVTGALLSGQSNSSRALAAHPTHHKSVDGFVATKHHKPQKAHKIAAHTVHAKPAKSTTLMRRAVHKPKITSTSANIDNVSKHVETFAERQHQEDLRFRRAIKVPTNKLVSRFGVIEPVDFKVQKTHTELPVRPAPVTQTHATKASPPPVQKTNHFEKSLENATAHTAKPLKKAKLHHRAAKKLHTKPKTLRIATTSMAVLLLAGFIAYQNSAIIAVRVAAARAGISATVPGYTPAGFHLQTHAAKPGQIIIGYKSTTDGRSYQLTQTASSWDSATLLQNFVAANNYQATTSKGRKVYLYDNNATWVDNGIWYKLESKANLSSTQLQQLIDSI